MQPQLAKSLFSFDADSGRLETVMGRTDEVAPSEPDAPAAGESELIEQVQQLAAAAGDDAASKADIIHKLDELAQQAVASDEKSIADAAKAASKRAGAQRRAAGATEVRQELAQAMTDFVAPPPPARRSVAPAAVVSDTATAEDDEMLEVFFEEAEEVIAGARESLAKLAEEPQHFESISTVRRAFHTLKGSSRMVGLKDFGEAAWACEQLYNARLADHVIEADPELRTFSLNVLDELEGWVKALAARNATGFHSAPIVAAANALRDGVDPDAEPAKPKAPAVDATAVLPPMPHQRARPKTPSSRRPRKRPATPRSWTTSSRPVPANWPLQRTLRRTRTKSPRSRWTCRSDAPDASHAHTELMEERTVVQPMEHAPEYAAPNFEFDLGDLDKSAESTVVQRHGDMHADRSSPSSATPAPTPCRPRSTSRVRPAAHASAPPSRPPTTPPSPARPPPARMRSTR